MSTNNSTTVPESGTPNQKIHSLLQQAQTIVNDDLNAAADSLRAIALSISEGHIKGQDVLNTGYSVRVIGDYVGR